MKLSSIEQEIFNRCIGVDEAERQYAIIAPKLSWGMLADLEPRLADLLRDARAADSYRVTESFCRESYWHRKLKRVLVQIVGHCRPDYHPILGTSAAYDLAYDTIYEATPDCRNCSCCGE